MELSHDIDHKNDFRCFVDHFVGLVYPNDPLSTRGKIASAKFLLSEALLFVSFFCLEVRQQYWKGNR